MSNKNKKFLGYILTVVAAFLLLFARSPFLSSLKLTLADGATLPVRILAFPFLELKKILFYHQTFEEYRRLQKEAVTLRSRIVGMDELLLQNSRMEKLLNFKRRLVYSSVAANVIARDPSNWNAAVIIDKGKDDGVEVGFPVVDLAGVVGKVIEISHDKAKVILMSDPSFSVAALVKRTREVGLVSGTLEGFCRMTYLSSGADVQVGDEIISSKMSSSFPEGLILGEVIAVRQSPGDLAPSCIIKPASALSQLEEVLVVINP